MKKEDEVVLSQKCAETGPNNQSSPEAQSLLERCSLLESALTAAIEIADQARDEWDMAPQGMKAGKLLMALAGHLPGYRADVDAIHRIHKQALTTPSATPAEPPEPWSSIPPGKRFGRRLTEDAVPKLAAGTLLRMHSEDPWFEEPDAVGEHEIFVFTGNVSNAFPKVGPHLEIATLDGSVIPGGGYVFHLFQFVADPAPTTEDLGPSIERVILRRLHENRIDGYTLEMSAEIAALAASARIATPAEAHQLLLRCEKCGRSMAYDRSIDPDIPAWVATLSQSHCDAPECDTSDRLIETWLDAQGVARDPAEGVGR